MGCLWLAWLLIAGSGYSQDKSPAVRKFDSSEIAVPAGYRVEAFETDL